MPCLLRDGEVVAALEVAPHRRALRGRPAIEGAVLVTGARRVRAGCAIDVAACDRTADGLVVLALRRRWRAPCLLVAEEGAFERWKLVVGDALEVAATS